MAAAAETVFVLIIRLNSYSRSNQKKCATRSILHVTNSGGGACNARVDHDPCDERSGKMVRELGIFSDEQLAASNVATSQAHLCVLSVIVEI